MKAIEDCIAENNYSFKDKQIGIINPTYFWGLPSIVSDFLKKAEFYTDYLYFIATYGTTPGAIGALAKEAIRNRDIDACYSVRMVDTYTPIFDISTNERQEKFTQNTEAEIEEVIKSVQERHHNKTITNELPITG